MAKQDDGAAKAADENRTVSRLATAARKKLTDNGNLDYAAMTTDELGALRVVQKREYETERKKSDAIYREKVTADRLEDSARAMGLPEGARIIVEPTPALMSAKED